MYKTARTYCNPLPIPNIPRGKDNWYALEHDMFSHENKPETDTNPDYRSISDPTVFYHGGKWYLYPSYGMAWVSEDFQRWDHVRTEPYCPKYSPHITRWGEKFLLVSWCSPLYEAEDPLGPFRKLGDFILPDGREFVPCDPCIFTDDDGRLYLYAFVPVPDDSPNGFVSTVMGYELDQTDPRKVIRGPVTVLTMDPEQNPWERTGRHRQDRGFGWVEGPHLLKHQGRYYLIYAAPDTCLPNYAMAVYYSDTDPLSGFVCQKRNPLTVHEYGIVSGAGHGSVEHGPNGTLWAFYTVAAPWAHMYERRIGMDLVAVDENGELYCPHGVTDTPQYIPGYQADPVCCNSLDYVNLTGGTRPRVSSTAPGRDGIYATDENNLSFWLPDPADLLPTVECDLTIPYEVGAVRLFWREIGLDYAAGKRPGPVGWLLEGKCRAGDWFPLVDCRDNDRELNIDYRPFPPAQCDRVRLTLTRKPAGLEIGVIDFAVFGRYCF